MAALIYWVPATVYAALIFFLSHQSQPLGSKFPTLVSDYVLHLVEYAGLTLTVIWGLTSGFRKVVSLQLVAVACLVTSLYGATDEFHQSFIPFREASLSDLTMDVLGALVTGFLVYWVKRGSRR